MKLLPVNSRTSMQHWLLLVEDLLPMVLKYAIAMSYHTHEAVSNNSVDRNTYDTCNTGPSVGDGNKRTQRKEQ